MKPVRTQVIETLVCELREIAEIKHASRFQPRPVDLDVIPTPALFIYDTLPEERSRNNLVMENTMELAIVVFIPLTAKDESTGNLEFSDLADIIQAEIHAVLYSGIMAANKAIVDVTESTVEREVQGVEFGELTYVIRVKYRHTRGDAFTTTI